MGSSFQDIKEKKKRYVYLAGENVGNFQTDAGGSIVVLTHNGVGCYCHICIKGLLRPSLGRGIVSSRFFIINLITQ